MTNNKENWEKRFNQKFIVKWEDVDEETYYRFNVDEFKKDVEPQHIETFIASERKLAQEEVLHLLEEDLDNNELSQKAMIKESK